LGREGPAHDAHDHREFDQGHREPHDLADRFQPDRLDGRRSFDAHDRPLAWFIPDRKRRRTYLVASAGGAGSRGKIRSLLIRPAMQKRWMAQPISDARSPILRLVGSLL